MNKSQRQYAEGQVVSLKEVLKKEETLIKQCDAARQAAWVEFNYAIPNRFLEEAYERAVDAKQHTLAEIAAQERLLRTEV